MSGNSFGYYDAYETMEFRCACGWAGPFSELSQELYAELFDASCPRCDAMLAIVSFPTGDEVRQAAKNGNAKARRDLDGVRRREAFRKRYDAMELTRPSQLPQIEGRDLCFLWDTEEKAGERHVVIRLQPGGDVVWRELEAWENWRHFLDVRALLRARYGSRCRCLMVSEGAWTWLLGDDTAGFSAVQRALAEDGIGMNGDQGGGMEDQSTGTTAPEPEAGATKAARVRKGSAAATKAALTRKRRTAGKKAALTKKRRTAGKKAALTKKRRRS